MEQKDFLKIKHGIENAQEDTKPVIAVMDDEVSVSGDVNDIKIEPKDYTARFVVPEAVVEEIPDAKKLGNGYATFEIEYKGVYPSAMNNMKYTSAMLQLEPFFLELKDDGGIDNMSDEDALRKIFSNMSDEIVEALYRVVKVVCGIDDELIEHLTPGSAVKIGSQIMWDFPTMVNQADLFFE